MKDTIPTESQLSLDTSYCICRWKKKERRSSFQVSGELKTILNGTFAREVFMYYPEGNGTSSTFLKNDTTSVNFLVTSRWAFVWQQDV